MTLVAPYEVVSGTSPGAYRKTVYPHGERHVVRNYRRSTEAASGTEALVRSYVAAANAAFSGLSDEQRATWDDGAEELTRIDTLGQWYAMSGHNFFLSVNVLRQLDGEAIGLVAPVVDVRAAVDEISSIVVTIGELFLRISFPPIDGPAVLMVELSDPLPGLQRKANKNDLKLATVPVEDSLVAFGEAIEGLDIAYDVLRYPWAAGHRVGAKVTTLSNGYVAGRFREADLVIGSE